MSIYHLPICQLPSTVHFQRHIYSSIPSNYKEEPYISHIMPPTRRKSSAPSSHAQKTLAFSGRSNKVTKPFIAHPSAKSLSKASPEQLARASKPVSEISSPETTEAHADSQPQEPEEVIIPGAEQGLAFRVQGAAPNLHDEVSEKARKVSDAQVKRYWRGKEEERKAPRGEPSIHVFPNDLMTFT